MKPCSTYESALIGLLEGKAEGDVQAHVQTCAACRAELEALQAMDARLYTLGSVYAQQAPEIDLVDSVMARVQAYKQNVAAAPESLEDADLLAYIEGDLDEFSTLRIEHLVESDAAVQQEVRGLASIHDELLHIGEAAQAMAPEVDLVESVMQKVRLANAPEAKVVPFRARPKAPVRTARTAWRWQWASLAAAACLVVGLWFAVSNQMFVQTPPRVAMLPVPPPAIDKGTGAAINDMSHEGELSTHKKSAASTEGENQVATDENTIKSGSLADAIGQRRKIEDFTKWANLTADEARALLKRGGLSADAIASISQFLPAEEAAGYLRDAVKQSPNDPYLRMALAKTLAGLPNGGTEALTQLAAWNKQDSKNSLNQFMEAQVRFKQGDNEGALNALTRGSALSSASAYSIQAAHGQELMLAAAGMSSDAARYTAASNIGGQEYSDINNLSRSLLQYGNYYQSTGDLETAQQVYQAVQQMGVQLVESAAVANEQLAGYDTQLQALEALRQVYEILADAQNLQALESAYSGVLDGLSQLSEVMGQISSMLIETPLQGMMNLVNQILQGGNLSTNGQ